MDSLTQAVLGAAVGEALLGRQLGWRAAAWGAAFGTLPDLDVLISPALDAVTRVYWHRGFSHSILMMALGALGFGLLLSKWWSRKSVPISLPRAISFVLLAWSTHVLIDCFTTYGTSLWSPFSGDRTWWNIMSIVDPLFTLPMIVGLIASVVIWRSSHRRSWGNALGLILSTLYVCFTIFMKTRIISPQFEAAFATAEARPIATSPMLLNSILWRGIAETDDAYLIGLYSPFDSDSKIQLNRINKNHHLLSDHQGTPELEALQWFSRGIYSVTSRPNGRLAIIDRRFGEMRVKGENVPIFSWEMWKDHTGTQFRPIKRKGTDEKISTQLLDLWNRILGDESKWN